jgi:hypothetical protein
MSSPKWKALQKPYGRIKIGLEEGKVAHGSFIIVKSGYKALV